MILFVCFSIENADFFLFFSSFFLPQSLLDEPNPNSPANSQAAQLYQENKREYEKRVTAIVEQSWVDVWASPRRCLLLPLHRPLFFITPVLQSLIFTSSKKNSNYIRRTQVPPWKKWKNKTTKPERTLTCLPIHFKENGGGEINLIFVFLVLNFTFFYCMMWNKLLLTEFVIYLCCLAELILLVFRVLQIFFLIFSFFFCNVCWCAHNLAV